MKKMFFYAASLCLTAVGFASCTAEDEAFPAAVVSITEEEVTVPAAGGAVSFNLTAPSNEAFTVKTPEWIEFNEDATITRGVNSSAAYHFTVAPAESCQERTGAIYIVAANGLQDSLVVVQEGVELAVDKTAVEAPAAGGVLAVQLTAVPGYTVTCPEWIVMNEDPATTHVGVQTAEVTFTIAQNTGANPREGEIVIACGDACGKEVKIAVAQQRGMDLSKMVNYAGTFTSLYDGAAYNSTIGLLWDENDETVVTICNLEPMFATNGFTIENGMNFVQGQYFPDANMIGIPFQSDMNLAYGGYVFAAGALNTPTLDEETSEYDHIYILLNDDKTTLTFPNALCTLAFQNGQFVGNWDMYAGGAVFTKVAE